jgi:hypothetical protein
LIRILLAAEIDAYEVVKQEITHEVETPRDSPAEEKKDATKEKHDDSAYDRDEGEGG